MNCEKNIFHWEKMEGTLWVFCPYHRMLSQKALRTYISSLCIWSIALVNELTRLNF